MDKDIKNKELPQLIAGEKKATYSARHYITKSPGNQCKFSRFRELPNISPALILMLRQDFREEENMVIFLQIGSLESVKFHFQRNSNKLQPIVVLEQSILRSKKESQIWYLVLTDILGIYNLFISRLVRGISQ